jgi:hypothetical protein
MEEKVGAFSYSFTGYVGALGRHWSALGGAESFPVTCQELLQDTLLQLLLSIFCQLNHKYCC